jgi:hypothetical protein
VRSVLPFRLTYIRARVKLPSHVQRHVTRVAIRMHNTFEKRNRIHRDAMNSMLSLDTSLVWRPLCTSIARTLLQTFDRRRLGAIEISTQMGISCTSVLLVSVTFRYHNGMVACDHDTQKPSFHIFRGAIGWRRSTVLESTVEGDKDFVMRNKRLRSYKQLSKKMQKRSSPGQA